MSLAFACVYLQPGCSFGIRLQSRIRISSLVRKLKIGVFGSLDFSGIGNMILGAMYAGVFVSLIIGKLFSCEEMRHTFPLSVRVEFGVLGLSWDFRARSVSELQLQLQLEAGKINWTRLESKTPIFGECIDGLNQWNRPKLG